MNFRIILPFAALFSVTSVPLLAQSSGDPLSTFQGMLKALKNKPAAQATSDQDRGQIASALRGKWEPNKSYCYEPSDTFIKSEEGSWAGYEWSCEVPASAYTTRGFSGTLTCASEGEEYQTLFRVELAADSQSLTVNKPEDRTTEKYVKCPKETEEIGY